MSLKDVKPGDPLMQLDFYGCQHVVTVEAVQPRLETLEAGGVVYSRRSGLSIGSVSRPSRVRKPERGEAESCLEFQEKKDLLDRIEAVFNRRLYMPVSELRILCKHVEKFHDI